MKGVWGARRLGEGERGREGANQMPWDLDRGLLQGTLEKMYQYESCFEG